MAHFCYTFDGSTLLIYVNGQNVSATATSGFGLPSTSFIGNRDGSSGKWEGDIDDVRIYNRALSATEVAYLYNSGAAQIAASSATLQNGTTLQNGLVGLWTFDGNDINWTSETVADRSGQGNTGTLNGLNQRSAVGGHLGQALSFDGSTSYVINSGFSLLGKSAATISAWFKTSSGQTNKYIVSVPNNSSGGDNGFDLHLKDATTLESWLNTTKPTPDSTRPSTIRMASGITMSLPMTALRRLSILME